MKVVSLKIDGARRSTVWVWGILSVLRIMKLTVLILYVAENVNGGIFGAALPTNGPIQWIVGGKCKYKLIINYFRTSKRIPVGAHIVSIKVRFYM